MTTEIKNQTCSECAHWNPVEPDQGECRRQPPQSISFKIDQETRFEARFPTTGSADWCGEFAAK